MVLNEFENSLIKIISWKNFIKESCQNNWFSVINTFVYNQIYAILTLMILVINKFRIYQCF